MTMRFAPTLRSALMNAITTFAGSSALLRFYDGTQPATGGTATTLLAQCTMNATFAPAASSGVLTLNVIGSASAVATGTCTWVRIVTSGGTFCIDMTASTVSAGTGDCQLDSVSIVNGGTVAVSSAVLTCGNP